MLDTLVILLVLVAFSRSQRSNWLLQSAGSMARCLEGELWVAALGCNEKAAAAACDRATGSHIDTTGPSTASRTKGCLAP